ncbi:DUF6870 family protein [Eisenbergiella massiliensis]|uniref:DUF6870 family protein n=1 Tax=Eisenbergiella massiliensis TaxID=1720294 RepID=UPI00399B57DB
MGLVMEERKNTAVQALDKSELAELSTVRVREDSQKQPDLEDLKRQTKNLYRYRVGNVVVEFDYLHNGRTVNDLFALMVQAGM